MLHRSPFLSWKTHLLSHYLQYMHSSLHTRSILLDFYYDLHISNKASAEELHKSARGWAIRGGFDDLKQEAYRVLSSPTHRALYDEMQAGLRRAEAILESMESVEFRLRDLRHKNLYGALRIQPDAPERAIKAAFSDRSKNCDPASARGKRKFFDENPAVRKRVKLEWNRITEARDVLLDRDMRSRYDEARRRLALQKSRASRRSSARKNDGAV